MADYRIYRVNTGKIYITDKANQLLEHPGEYLHTLRPDEDGLSNLSDASLDHKLLAIGTTVHPAYPTTAEQRRLFTMNVGEFPQITSRGELPQSSYDEYKLRVTKYASALDALREKHKRELAALGSGPSLADLLKPLLK